MSDERHDYGPKGCLKPKALLRAASIVSAAMTMAIWRGAVARIKRRR